MQKILFVCTGNICRSPTAEGMLRHRIKDAGLSSMISCDSAGTHNYHIGEPPDRRSISAARARHITIDDLRARQVCAEDFQKFNVILGLDASHVAFLERMAPKNTNSKIFLFLDYAGLGTRDVPDPYYGDYQGFEQVLDLIDEGVTQLIKKWKAAL